MSKQKREEKSDKSEAAIQRKERIKALKAKWKNNYGNRYGCGKVNKLRCPAKKRLIILNAR
jgi:hypothetical protein